MNKHRGLKLSTAIFLTLGSLYLFSPWEYVVFYLQPVPETLTEQLSDAVEEDIEGMVLYVDKKGKQPISLAAGWHNREQRIPAKPDALFKIGSISKLYTNVLLTQLHVAGKISLDKTLADYLPELSKSLENADKITLKMMIKHRSGLPNYTDNKDFDWSKSYSFDEIIQSVNSMSNSFEPDADYQYSNTNYLLLRTIMSKQLEHDYRELIAPNILKPLGLSNTYASIHEVEIDRVMGGYHIGYEQNFNYVDQGVLASAHDVAVFIRALNDGSLLNEQENDLYSELYVKEHTGWVLGHSSIAHYEEETDTVVVQFTNTTGNDIVLLTKIIYQRIVEIINESS